MDINSLQVPSCRTGDQQTEVVDQLPGKKMQFMVDLVGYIVVYSNGIFLFGGIHPCCASRDLTFPSV